MAGKAKFDQEAAFKSIIGAGRQNENAVVAEEQNAKNMNKAVYSRFADIKLTKLDINL